MPRAYHVATAAVAIDCPLRWLDNLLSQFDVPGVISQTRGVTRQVSLEALLHIAVARALAAEIGLPIGRSIRLASTLCANGDGSIVLAPGLSVQLDLTRFRQTLEQRLIDAVETAVPPRRGRPPRARRGPTHG